MTTPPKSLAETPYWQKVLAGEEPVYCDSYSGRDWADAQLEAYSKALREAAAEIERLGGENLTLELKLIASNGSGHEAAKELVAAEAERDSLAKRVEKLSVALAWYANVGNYQLLSGSDFQMYAARTMVDHDGGSIAYRALTSDSATREGGEG